MQLFRNGGSGNREGLTLNTIACYVVFPEFKIVLLELLRLVPSFFR